MLERLAIQGGTPVRSTVLPYGRQDINEEDIEAVVQALRSDWLTSGPRIDEFERAFANAVGATDAVAVSSGTAALHAAMFALGIGPGDEVIVTPMTFAASANCVLYQGGIPVFADVDEETLLIDPAQVEARITARTKAIIAVDYAGQPCDYDALRIIAQNHGLSLIADACHALGGSYKGRSVGTLGDLNVFSLHPVKHITTGEGGVITTDDEEFARRMRVFRNHGITTDHRQRAQAGSFFYEMVDLGYNYRITDFQCALGLSQLRRLSGRVAKRQQLAAMYDSALRGLPYVKPLFTRRDRAHAYHLYVVKFDLEQLNASRKEIFAALHSENIGVNVHYIPVYFHPYYQTHLGMQPGLCPVAESVFERIISLPMFSEMTNTDLEDVVEACTKLVQLINKEADAPWA